MSDTTTHDTLRPFTNSPDVRRSWDWIAALERRVLACERPRVSSLAEPGENWVKLALYLEAHGFVLGTQAPGVPGCCVVGLPAGGVQRRWSSRKARVIHAGTGVEGRWAPPARLPRSDAGTLRFA